MTRTGWQGARQILSFNRRFYLRASFALAIAFGAAAAAPHLMRALLLATAAPALFWMAASLAVSHYVYDRSPLYSLAWLSACLPRAPGSWINLHAGLDEITPALRALFPGADGRSLNIFDPRDMTEPSIQQAQRAAAPGEPADWRALPTPSASSDAAFLIFTAHELRSHKSRAKLFREVARSLRPGGTLVVAEHLRDAANFLVFGPGFLHFHSGAAWTRAAADSGLALDRHFRITPFVQVYILRRNP